MAKCLKFGSSILMDYQTQGAEVLESTIPFSEIELYKTFEKIILAECNVDSVEYIEINETDKLKNPAFK